MPMLKRTFAALLLVTTAPTLAAPADDLKRVMDAHWAWFLRSNPVYATALGTRDYDERINDISLAEADRQAKQAETFLTQLKAIPDAQLSAEDRTNKAILSRILAEQVEGNRFGQRQVLFTTYYGWHQGFAGMAENLPFRTRADFDSYLRRLAQYPALNQEAIRITKAGAARGFIQPCDAMKGFEKSIIGVVTDDPAKSRFYAPFAGAKPADVSDAEWGAMQARARTLITDTLNPEYRRFHDYYVKEYAPKCRKTVGASAMPGGAEYYAFRARAETTTDLTPEQIHQLGLKEVARIRAEMEQVAKGAGFATREAFIQELRTNPKYYAKTPEELLAAAAWQAKRIDGMLPQFFGRLPRLPYGVKPIPAEIAEGTTTAYAQTGSLVSGIASQYFVNTSKLDQRPLWELAALTPHEAAPGHLFQLGLQQELELPDFRKYQASFTAYVEGWALYTERLGIEMGLYDTPEEQMGRLSYEMWRATRLVVDTGIHAKGWTKEQAVAFMTDNTALSAANIDAEVNRYISWPGQALGYKIGELKIRELRARAEAELGPKFDLRRFHDAVLVKGSVPLDVLEAQITAWIAGEKVRS
jgi:uncharacterized protein (DUF885 family)